MPSVFQCLPTVLVVVCQDCALRIADFGLARGRSNSEAVPGSDLLLEGSAEQSPSGGADRLCGDSLVPRPRTDVPWRMDCHRNFCASGRNHQLRLLPSGYFEASCWRCRSHPSSCYQMFPVHVIWSLQKHTENRAI